MATDIGPSRIHLLVGAALLCISVLPGWIAGTAIYYDGLSSIKDWPPLFIWLSGIFLVSVSLGIYALFTPQLAGADVRFDGDRVSLRIKNLLQREEKHDLRWSDVEQVILVEGPRNQSELKLELRSRARVTLRIQLVETSASETIGRFQAAAERSGYTFERDGGYNVLVMRKQIMAVHPAS